MYGLFRQTDPPRARHGEDLVHSLFQHLACLRQAAQRSRRGTGHRSHPAERGDEQEFLPQSDLDIRGDFGRHPRPRERLPQPFSPLAGTVVQLAAGHVRLQPGVADVAWLHDKTDDPA